jgi:hypothetical protein
MGYIPWLDASHELFCGCVIAVFHQNLVTKKTHGQHVSSLLKEQTCLPQFPLQRKENLLLLLQLLVLQPSHQGMVLKHLS